jgi:hypothetical protein
MQVIIVVYNFRVMVIEENEEVLVLVAVVDE